MSHVNKIITKILEGLLIWFFIHSIVFAFPTFDGGMYILDENYLVGGWPGKIWERYENTGSFSRITQIEDEIEKYVVTNDYILLNAGNDWYAINRQDHIISQFENQEDLKNTLKLQNSISFKSSRPWLRMRFFWPAALISITSGICVFILLFFKEIKMCVLYKVKLRRTKRGSPLF